MAASGFHFVVSLSCDVIVTSALKGSILVYVVLNNPTEKKKCILGYFFTCGKKLYTFKNTLNYELSVIYIICNLFKIYYSLNLYEIQLVELKSDFFLDK